jgi:hypothetical protein
MLVLYNDFQSPDWLASPTTWNHPRTADAYSFEQNGQRFHSRVILHRTYTNGKYFNPVFGNIRPICLKGEVRIHIRYIGPILV